MEAVVAQKDAKIAQKNEVISKLMEENVLAKKPVGSSEKTLGEGGDISTAANGIGLLGPGC